MIRVSTQAAIPRECISNKIRNFGKTSNDFTAGDIILGNQHLCKKKVPRDGGYSIYYSPSQNICKISCELFSSLAFDFLSSSSEMAFRQMSHSLTDDKATLLQVMTWNCQTTSHYPNLCWPSSVTFRDVTRGQRVRNITCDDIGHTPFESIFVEV